jgi:hypothetical protein
MYLLSITVNYHTCCGLVLLFGNNCPYECRNNCRMSALRHVWYNAVVNLQCIIECRPESMKSLLVWPTVLFEATIFVRMMHWSCDTFILEKIKGTFFVKSGFIFMFRLSFRLIFSFLQSHFSLPWNYMCLGIERLFNISIFTAVDKVKDRILYNKVWKDNWTYWYTCQYWWKRQLNAYKSLKQVKITDVWPN